VLGERLGGWFAELHRAEGVEVLTGRSVTDAWGTRRVQWLELSDSTLVETDHVLVAVGARPDVAWLARSGISNGGVHVDIDGRTAIPEVFAAGDAAATRDPKSGSRVAGSHWEAAGRQAVRAARAMLGLEPGEVELASFWTDQYGLRIQYLGDAPLADAITIDGEAEGRDFVASYTRMGRPVAALLVNRPRSLPEIRRLIKIGTAT
jgi:NADPH-dependent 2,4-dienoyl-CoA reductase/sulfur reductase-like enzyme